MKIIEIIKHAKVPIELNKEGVNEVRIVAARDKEFVQNKQLLRNRVDNFTM